MTTNAHGYYVNFDASNIGDLVVRTPRFDLVIEHSKFNTPIQGQKAYVLKNRASGITLAEGVDVALAVRRTILETQLLEFIANQKDLGVPTVSPGDSPSQDDGLGDLTTPNRLQ